MELINEKNALWDHEKERIVGEAKEGTFDMGDLKYGETLFQEWWKLIDEHKRIIGFGWVYKEEDDFEISVAVDKEHQGNGAGSFILGELEGIAKQLGFHQVIGIIKSTNQEATEVIEWLYRNGYVAYWPGFQGSEPKNQHVAFNIVKKCDLTLTKNI